jgi:hypothetical protein
MIGVSDMKYAHWWFAFGIGFIAMGFGVPVILVIGAWCIYAGFFG